MKELEALERINKRFGIFSLDDISDFYLINEALTELEDLRESNKEMRKLLDEAYSKIPSKNNCDGVATLKAQEKLK